MPDVLVVDDDPDIRALLALALTDAGFDVREAADGGAALEALATKAPDALVLDVMMPVHDGFEVLRRMKSQGLAEDTVVLLLTTKTAERDRLLGWTGGVDEYVTKPFDPVALAVRIGDLLHAGEDELDVQRTSERDRATLLSRLEAAFDGPERVAGHRPASPGASRLQRRSAAATGPDAP